VTVDHLDPDTDPADITDPQLRTMALLKHWHVDEVTDFEDATDYAVRLVEKLAEHGLEIREIEV
jgi:hypothetical protein